MESSTGGFVTALTNKRLLLGAALGAALLLLLLGTARSAEAAPTCSTWQGWQYCGESDVFPGGPPGYGAASWKVQLSGYTYPCVYVSFKVGTQWYPQADLCAGPYNYFIHHGSGSAICIYGEHWIRDAVSTRPRLTTYIWP